MKYPIRRKPQTHKVRFNLTHSNSEERKTQWRSAGAAGSPRAALSEIILKLHNVTQQTVEEFVYLKCFSSRSSRLNKAAYAWLVTYSKCHQSDVQQMSSGRRTNAIIIFHFDFVINVISTVNGHFPATLLNMACWPPQTAKLSILNDSWTSIDD